MNAPKEDTLKIRIDSETLNLLERARSYLDVNKSRFIRMSVREGRGGYCST